METVFLVRPGICVLILKWALQFLANQDTIKTNLVQFGAKNVQREKAATLHQLAIAQLEATLTSATWTVMSALIDIFATRKTLLLLFYVLLALILTEKETLNAQSALLEVSAFTEKNMIVPQTNIIQKKVNRDVHYVPRVISVP